MRSKQKRWKLTYIDNFIDSIIPEMSSLRDDRIENSSKVAKERFSRILSLLVENDSLWHNKSSIDLNADAT